MFGFSWRAFTLRACLARFHIVQAPATNTVAEFPLLTVAQVACHALILTWNLWLLFWAIMTDSLFSAIEELH